MSAALLAAMVQAVVSVGPGGAHATIAAGLAAAGPWDTVLVAAGVYHEHPRIDRPVVLAGERGAVIDGDGRGTILSVRAPAVVRGLTLRNSGGDQSREHAGLLAEGAAGLIVEHNRFEDVLFGIYLKQSDGAVVRHNEIEGKNLPVTLRGDGIRLWYSHAGLVADNVIRRSRDLVIWFCNDTDVRRNRVVDSRYGLHYMYSNRNHFEDNEFVRNHIGAFIMYSTDITFRGNLFADAHGTTGRGLGFKDSDRVTAVGNVMVKNAVGISIDNSPHSEGVTNEFRDNIVAYNDVGVALLPSVHDNVFRGNAFLSNVRPVSVSGGGTALANRWLGNHWSEYAGFDRDGDGLGDTPFRFDRLSDDILAAHDDLQVLELGPAVTALNTLSRVLPLLRPEAVVVDSAPRVTSPPIPSGHLADRRPAAVLFLAAALAAGAVAYGQRRPFGRPR